MYTRLLVVALVVQLAACGAAAPPDGTPLAAGLAADGPYHARSERNLLTEVDPRADRGAIRVVIEIPAGTTAKWQVDHTGGRGLEWEMEDGHPRRVAYLAYPANYGIIPRTVLPREAGGDGDPLDVLLLGPAVARGAVVEARLIGVLRMLDGGEADDKLVAVPLDGSFAAIGSMAELDDERPGVSLILETWFANYKGVGVVETSGFGERDEAEAILAAALEAFGD